MELVEKYGFITMIGEKLAPFELSVTTYNALFEVKLKFIDCSTFHSGAVKLSRYNLS